jgi:hypothetical protein
MRRAPRRADGDARRLRAGGPQAKAAVLVVPGRILEALAAILRGGTAAHFGLSRSGGQKGRENRESRRRNRELSHHKPPFFQLANPPWVALGCIGLH